ncbi:MAG: hypothetical protein WA902_15035 [Thermosynechococcaceae cyanobacterium]
MFSSGGTLQANPNYPHIVLAFHYRDWKVEIDKGEMHGYPAYSVWASNNRGCTVAVPHATSRKEAVERAKQWIDRREAESVSS